MLLALIGCGAAPGAGAEPASAGPASAHVSAAVRPPEPRCSLHRVRPDGMAVDVPVGGSALPRGSLVQRTGDCEAGAAVTVLSVQPWYRTGAPVIAPGATACVSASVLEDPGDARWIVGPGGAESPPAGQVLDPVAADAPCGGSTVRFGATEVPVVAIPALVPASPDGLADARSVQAAYERHFGPIGLDRVGVTDWGYVSLPFTHVLTDPERAQVQREERMLTDLQREKATSALGPPVGAEHAYTHFLGADVPLTDTWGRPGTVRALIDLAAGWYAHCTGELASDPAMAADPRTCTLQVGDVAYYGPHDPDPLGHYDHGGGQCVDLRLFRTDGSRYEAWWNRADDRDGFGMAYNGPLTKAFVAYTLANAQVEALYFNDPAVHGAFAEVLRVARHDDHLHVCFGAP